MEGRPKGGHTYVFTRAFGQWSRVDRGERELRSASGHVSIGHGITSLLLSLC